MLRFIPIALMLYGLTPVSLTLRLHKLEHAGVSM